MESKKQGMVDIRNTGYLRLAETVADTGAGELADGRVTIGCCFLIQAAALAGGMGPANVFGQPNEQGMVFVEQRGVGWQIRRKEQLIGRIAVDSRGQPHTAYDAAGVGIDDEGGLISGIQYYGVGSFLADAVNGKELPA